VPPSSVETHAVVKESALGKTFSQLLVDEGFRQKDANRLLVNPLIPPKMHINPHEKYLVLTDAAKNRTEVRFYLDYSNDALIFWHDAEQAGVEKKTIPFTIVKEAFQGKVRGSLIESIKHLVPDEWAAFRFADAFSWDINVSRELVQNDAFRFSIEKKYDQGQFVKLGEITEAELDTHGSKMKRLLWEDKDTKVFVDPSTRFESRPFFAPVDYIHISSTFARRRLHPVRHNYQPHLGVDLALTAGSPIYAAREGVIQEAARHHANGNYITIQHTDNYYTTYNHMDHMAPGMVPGKHVVAGEIIGYVGCTGYCTSPHLDFRVRRGDYLYDPMLLTKPYPFKERNYWETSKFKDLVNTM
jgi:murein DD-endopeptidase MepM/ murein hydrolase activator NlpD